MVELTWNQSRKRILSRLSRLDPSVMQRVEHLPQAWRRMHDEGLYETEIPVGEALVAERGAEPPPTDFTSPPARRRFPEPDNNFGSAKVPDYLL